MGFWGRKKKQTEEGQATVEFALTLMLTFAMVFFFIQLSLMFAWGSYVQYATFMSARAYMAAGPNEEDQVARAKSVISRMVKKGESASGRDRFPFVAKGDGGGDPNGVKIGPAEQFDPMTRSSSWMEGVRYTFKSRLFMIPFGKGAPAGNDPLNQVTLTSESWLGREPAYAECVTEMNKQKGFWDNGC